MLHFLLVPVAFVALTASAVAGKNEPNVFTQYNDLAHRVCPSHHIEDFTDGQYDTVLGDYLQSFPANEQARIAAAVDYPKTCANETAGFSCEFGAHLQVFRKLGLFDKFVSYSCRNWRCEEPALCAQIKPRP